MTTSQRRTEITIGEHYWVQLSDGWHRVWVYAGECGHRTAQFECDGLEYRMSWDAFYDARPVEETDSVF